MKNRVRFIAALSSAALAGGALALVPATGSSAGTYRVSHVLVISIDGGHQSDLEWFAATHPQFQPLLAAGTQYTHASTPLPSDPMAGQVGQLTGGNPKTTGVFASDAYDRSLLPAGTTNCDNAKPGGEVGYTGAIDRDPSAVDAGQRLSGLPDGVLGMTPAPQSLINPAKLPVDPETCKPVYPHSYLNVNTIFEVAKAHGLRTAWADEHPAYEILNGPSGRGIDDLFTPEISSTAPAPATGDWTQDNAATRQYDGYKAQAIINEIDGYDHSGTQKVGVPAVFGLNFESVASAQRLASTDGQPGGYVTANGQTTPGPVLADSLTYVDSWVGKFVAEIQAQGLAGSTAIIVSARNGGSPTEPAALTRVDDRSIVSGLNAAWAALHPYAHTPLVAFSSDGDSLSFWLNDRSWPAVQFARLWLLAHPVTGTTLTGGQRTLAASGTQAIYAGDQVAGLFGVRPGDPRHPDIYAEVQHGVVYTSDANKIADSGGADEQDRHVALLELLPGLQGTVVDTPVETTQIAPTVLTLLGLDPNELSAVRAEHTGVLRVS